MKSSNPRHTWPIAEAETRLSEMLRRAEEEGPQRIDAGRPFIVVPERLWHERPTPGQKPLGQWLVENMPRGADLEIPGRRESRREIPFFDEETT